MNTAYYPSESNMFAPPDDPPIVLVRVTIVREVSQEATVLVEAPEGCDDSALGELALQQAEKWKDVETHDWHVEESDELRKIA